MPKKPESDPVTIFDVFDYFSELLSNLFKKPTSAKPAPTISHPHPSPPHTIETPEMRMQTWQHSTAFWQQQTLTEGM